MTTTLLSSLREQLGETYAIERELGRGGMGAVYLARDRRLDRPVALKVLPPEISGEAGQRARFLRETRMVAGFSHPNIVPVFAVEETSTVVAFAMGFVDGESLTARVQRAGPLTTREAVRLLQDIGYALAYAHGRGVVHRDLKPDNIMIERATGRALLMDFGIARAVDAAPAGGGGLTRVGEIVGTPEFMSPEQASGDVLDGRSDLYALGLVAYYALTGTLAISGDSMSRILVKQLTEPVPSVGTLRGDVPAALLAVIERCVEKDPAARFPTAEALVEAIDSAQLAGTEVAVPVRELAQELAALPMALAVGLLIIDLMLDLNSARGWALADGLTSITLVIAVLVARIAQTMALRRRLGTQGFSGEAILAGFAALLEERAADRASVRARPGQTRRQQVWLALGIAMLPGSRLLGELARAARTQIGPMRYEVPPLASAAFFVSSAMVGVGLVLIGKSPLLALNDRLFRLLWMGALGRAVLEWGGPPSAVGRTVPPTGASVGPSQGGTVGGAVGATPSRPSPAPTPGPLPRTGDAGAFAERRDDDDLRGIVRALDARVRALEHRVGGHPDPRP